MPCFDLIATTTFGMESVVARELSSLGYVDLRTSDGRVDFSGDEKDIARLNLWLRTADRLLIRLGEFHAENFDQLFDQTMELPWNELLPVDAKFPVAGRSVRSRLTAVPKVQGAVKKAIVENMKRKYNRFRFDETGAEFPIEVSLHHDVATLTIDTSGDGLHKRGYRAVVGAAPLRETMAAGLIQLSYWNRERLLVDPFCGSGTIPIEAAMIGRNIAPGLSRSFISEEFPWMPRSLWRECRNEAKALRQPRMPDPVIAFDHDPGAIRLAERHASEAGVLGDIRFREQEISDLSFTREFGCIICNPPYGERLGDAQEVEAVYREMGRVFAPLETWSIYVLTSNRWFEKHFGRRAPRRRKLYNGRLECQYYQYPGPPPGQDPRPESDAVGTSEPESARPESEAPGSTNPD
ncbi:MAG: class I SAM-dependent RNA methyltransferase [Planctomycetaceae bacterium]|nr:class I SAM-dependent RNA methyltransferase [Planctomycetaceae bacterium]